MTRKKIAYLYYRNWAYEILKHIHQIQIERKDFVISDVICLEDTSDDLSFLDSQTSIHYVDPTKPNDLINIFKASNAKLVFCYSWSWIIPSEIVDSYHCICLHPSKLPEYRGGSPIQNQVLDGVLDSAVTVFKMNSGIDTGPIYRQIRFSLDAPIEEVFKRMSGIGKVVSNDLIADYLNEDLLFENQGNENASIAKRRKPSESCISIEAILNINFIDFQRMVNVLRDPYPNLNIEFGEFLLNITRIHFFSALPENKCLLSKDSLLGYIQDKEIFVETLDGFALISEYSIKKRELA